MAQQSSPCVRPRCSCLGDTSRLVFGMLSLHHPHWHRLAATSLAKNINNSCRKSESLKKQAHKDSMTTLQILHGRAMSNACSLKCMLLRTYMPMASTCLPHTADRLPYTVHLFVHKMSSPQDGSPRDEMGFSFQPSNKR